MLFLEATSIEAMLRDIVTAFRALLNRPGFTLAAVSMFAVGVVANTAMFAAT